MPKIAPRLLCAAIPTTKPKNPMILEMEWFCSRQVVVFNDHKNQIGAVECPHPPEVGGQVR